MKHERERESEHWAVMEMNMHAWMNRRSGSVLISLN
jgi:hypothetical protein